MEILRKSQKERLFLLPAMIRDVILDPSANARVLEVYINTSNMS